VRQFKRELTGGSFGPRLRKVTYVLANIELNDKKLSDVLTDPFKTIVEAKKKALSGSDPNIWCRIVDALQTSAIRAHNDYKLKNFAELCQLSSTLIDE